MFAVRGSFTFRRAIEAERNARLDDVTLLIDLLTEGWRALNTRLDRIEAALAAQPSNVVHLRESA